jgi:putative glutamine amidotransferase
MTRPFIGITLDHHPGGGYSNYPWYALRQNYCDAVSDAGGIPVLIPYYDQHRAPYLDHIQGLLVPGGAFDIDPLKYGQRKRHKQVTVNRQRCDFDLLIIQEALKRRLPFLGICAGMQALNVALGGTLHQHILQDIPGSLDHEQPPPHHLPSHAITIKENTRLFHMAQSASVQVNSTHHQGVDCLGHGLRVSAQAPDGVIEAIELEDHPFFLGVEWHPEYQYTELDRSLFHHFIKEAASGTHR